MKKRFTDADIWQKTWFRKLAPIDKALFYYIKDTCDQAGVWEADFELASFCIGDNVAESNFIAFGDRIEKIGDDKFWLVGFIDFQFGRLSKDSAPHRSVLKTLDRHGLLDTHLSNDRPDINYIKFQRKRLTQKAKNEILLRDRFTCQYCGDESSNCVIDHIIPLSKGGNNSKDNLLASCAKCNSSKSTLGLQEWMNKINDKNVLDRVSKILDRVSNKLDSLKEEDKDKEEDKEKDKEKELSSFFKKIDKYALNFEDAWQMYPEKSGKKQAEKHFNATVKTLEDFESLKIAIKNYLQSPKPMAGFIKNGSTFFNDWKAWVSPTPQMMINNAKNANSMLYMPNPYETEGEEK